KQYMILDSTVFSYIYASIQRRGFSVSIHATNSDFLFTVYGYTLCPGAILQGIGYALRQRFAPLPYPYFRSFVAGGRLRPGQLRPCRRSTAFYPDSTRKRPVYFID